MIIARSGQFQGNWFRPSLCNPTGLAPAPFDAVEHPNHISVKNRARGFYEHSLLHPESIRQVWSIAECELERAIAQPLLNHIDEFRAEFACVGIMDRHSAMDIQSYLKRINYDGPVEPTAETLRQLQLAHLLAVPFENLSIHNHEPIVLSDEALFEKIVTRRRGGFCYELNGLFSALLRALGFDVAMLSAQVANAEGEFGPDFDHMALMVSIDERWLADVGFGDSFVAPLLLDEREAQIQGNRRYQIAPDKKFLMVQSREAGNDWKPEYRFTLRPYQYSAYAEMCEYHQTSPKSHFTRGRICSRLTPGGRITLSDMRFISTEDDDRRERPIGSQEEYAAVLHKDFGIVI